jgi:hypothetical protein
MYFLLMRLLSYIKCQAPDSFHLMEEGLLHDTKEFNVSTF